MMKKFTFDIPAPADPALTKIRFFLARVDSSKDLFKAENIVYDGDYVENISITEFTQGNNLYCVEYYGDGITPVRSRFNRSVYLINDHAMWETLPEEKRFYARDNLYGALTPLADIYSESAPWVNLFRAKTSELLGQIHTTVFSENQVISEGVCILDKNGAMRLYQQSHNLNSFLGYAEIRQAMAKLSQMPIEDRRVDINGYIWQACYNNLDAVKAIQKYTMGVRNPDNPYLYSLEPDTIVPGFGKAPYVYSFNGIYIAVSPEDQQLLDLCTSEQEALDLVGTFNLYESSSLVTSYSSELSFTTILPNNNGTTSSGLTCPIFYQYVGRSEE